MSKQTKHYVSYLTTITLLVILAGTQFTYAYFGSGLGGGTADTSRSNRDGASHESSNLSLGTIQPKPFVTPPPAATPPVKASPSPSPSPRSKHTHDYKTMATVAALKCGVDVKLFHSLIRRESSWNPKALSSAGAYGLTQLMPGTAKWLMVNREDEEQNLEGGACYLAWLIDENAGNVRRALHAYNAGPGNLKKGNINSLTRQYASDILGSM